MMSLETDVLVVGGGAAAIAAANSARRNGANVMLVEAGPMLGGELNTGMPVDGIYTARGDQVVGGFATLFFDTCKRYGDFIGKVCDFRATNVICVDPEACKLAAIELIYTSGVQVLLYTIVDQVVLSEDGSIDGVIIRNKRGRTIIRPKFVIDATDDGKIVAAAGCESMTTNADPLPQVETLVFRMAGVVVEDLLGFVRQSPENISVLEYPGFAPDRDQAIQGLVTQGKPAVVIASDAPVLKRAIAEGRMFQASQLAIMATSEARREVSVTTTPASPTLTKGDDWNGRSFGDLHSKVEICARFLQSSVPGFGDAVISGLPPLVARQQAHRVVGDYVLTGTDVIDGRTFDDGIARGCREVLPNSGETGIEGNDIKDGGAFDIPFRCVLPKGVKNLMAAGRCASMDAEAFRSVRAIGSCMAMGQAAGTAAAMAGQLSSVRDLRRIDVGALRTRLRDQGAILDGAN